MEQLVPQVWMHLPGNVLAASADLSDDLALVAGRICTSYIDPSALQPFIA